MSLHESIPVEWTNVAMYIGMNMNPYQKFIVGNYILLWCKNKNKK